MCRVHTEPREVERDLLAEVVAHVVQRLVSEPAAVARPVPVEDLPVVQLLGISALGHRVRTLHVDFNRTQPD